MRRLLVTVMTVALLSTGVAATAADDAFTDVGPDHPFYMEIEAMADAGVIRGYPDGTFRSTAPVTREATAAFLYRYTVGPDIPACGVGPRVFTDVPASHPFCGAIEWLAAEGIATGWTDGTFRPGLPVSREAAAAFLYRLWVADTIPACTGDVRTFTDVPAGHPFCGAIEALYSAGIVDGWADTVFRPGWSVERQAMAAFLYRGTI